MGRLAMALALGIALIFVTSSAEARDGHRGPGGGFRGGPAFGGPSGGAKFSGGGPTVRSFNSGGGARFRPGAFDGVPKFGGFKAQGGGGFNRPHIARHHRHRGLRFYTYGAPAYYYYDTYPIYDEYYDDADAGCAHLWKRYLRTGNPKWKYRYYDCID